MAEELKKHLDNIETTVEAFVMACLYNVENAKNLKEVKEVVKCGLHKTMNRIQFDVKNLKRQVQDYEGSVNKKICSLNRFIEFLRSRQTSLSSTPNKEDDGAGPSTKEPLAQTSRTLDSTQGTSCISFSTDDDDDDSLLKVMVELESSVEAELKENDDTTV